MNKLSSIILTTVITCSLGGLSMTAHATDAMEEHPAIEACKDKNLHNNCSFTTSNNKTMNGTCAARPKHEKELICHPEKQHK